jgi:hypothetical protein
MGKESGYLQMVQREKAHLKITKNMGSAFKHSLTELKRSKLGRKVQ